METKSDNETAEGTTSGEKSKSNFLVKCPMYCRINCASKHHPLLVALLNCKDTPDKLEMYKRLKELEHVVERYDSTGKWEKDDPIPDNIESYRYPMVHWAAALGYVNALKWLINHGMSANTVSELFGKETTIQKALLCLQETSPNDCYEKFEKILVLLESALWVTDNVGSTVFHTCAEYMANDIPKFQYFQHCFFSIIFYLRAKGKDSDLRSLVELQNSEGNTCLHILCRSDKCGLIVRSLLKETKEENPVVTVIRNAMEERPVDVAKRWGCPRIFRFLKNFTNSEFTDVDCEEDVKLLYKTNLKTNIVYDRRGNIIGEKIDVKSGISPTEHLDVAEPGDVKSPSESSEPSVKKRKVSSGEDSGESDSEETRQNICEVALVIPPESTRETREVVQKKISLQDIKSPITEGNAKSEYSSTDSSESSRVPVTKMSSNIPFITNLEKVAGTNRKWKSNSYVYTLMSMDDHEKAQKLLAQCDTTLQTTVLSNLKSDYSQIKEQLLVLQTNEDDLKWKYKVLQDTQKKMVVEVQTLLQRMSSLKREEKKLTTSIGTITSEINTTHTTHQGLNERLQHCKAALKVLCDIYTEEQAISLID